MQKKIAPYISETQTLWSQTNYNFTVFTENNTAYRMTTALFRTRLELKNKTVAPYLR